MSRRLLIFLACTAGLAVVAPLSMAKPKHHVRKAHHVRRLKPAKPTRPLVMTIVKNGYAFLGGALSALATPTPSAHVSYQGYRCETTVGIGTTDGTPQNYFVTDSSEFWFAYLQGGHQFYSVTSNCVGKLPAATVHSSSIVSHAVACRQFNPFNSSLASIQGYGISTTYPDGLFSETCNTPDFS